MANYVDYDFTILRDPQTKIKSIGDRRTIERITRTPIGIQVESESQKEQSYGYDSQGGGDHGRYGGGGAES